MGDNEAYALFLGQLMRAMNYHVENPAILKLEYFEEAQIIWRGHVWVLTKDAKILWRGHIGMPLKFRV